MNEGSVASWSETPLAISSAMDDEEFNCSISHGAVVIPAPVTCGDNDGRMRFGRS